MRVIKGLGVVTVYLLRSNHYNLKLKNPSVMHKTQKRNNNLTKQNVNLDKQLKKNTIQKA